MEKNQNTQQSSLSSLKLARRSGRRLRLPAGCKLISLLRHHPWLIWSGLWLFLLATTVTAIFSLTNSDYVAQEEPQSKPVTVENPTETSFPTGSAMPLGLLSAVALTCAAGYMVISKKLNSSSRPAKLRKSAESSSAQMLTRRQRREQLQKGLPLAPLEQIPPVTPPLPAEVEPVVTVLPPEESHPLDSGEESLAEMMDIRKQRSLSSILGESFEKE